MVAAAVHRMAAVGAAARDIIRSSGQPTARRGGIVR
jgi:hypothetical protein